MGHREETPMSFLSLDQASGPACPACGCGESIVFRADSRPARILRQGVCVAEIVQVTQRRRCGHCGLAWTLRENRPSAEPDAIPETFEPPAIEPEPPEKPRCPQCGGEMVVTSTRKAIRYHKCPDCGTTAKTPR
jgi:hypothetical protein